MDFHMMQAVYYHSVKLNQFEYNFLLTIGLAAKDSNHYPSPSIKRIVDRSSLSNGSAQRALRSLKDRGIVTIQKRKTASGQKRNVYMVNLEKLGQQDPIEESLPKSITGELLAETSAEVPQGVPKSTTGGNYDNAYNKSINKSNIKKERKNIVTYKTHKTQGGSLEGDGDEGGNPKDMVRDCEQKPRALKEIFALLRAEYKEDFPAAEEFIGWIITTEFTESTGSKEYAMLLKELTDIESNGWCKNDGEKILFPLNYVRARLRGYVPHLIKDFLKGVIISAKYEIQMVQNDIEYAKRCNAPLEIPKHMKRIDAAKNEIAEANKLIAKVPDKEEAKRRRQAAAGAVAIGRGQR